MQNLLSANLFQLRRHKAFWAAAGFMVVYALAEAVGLYRQGDSVVGDGLFAFLSFFGVVLAAFCTLYLGTEYHDGTIRNKVAAGFRRGQIYGAYLLACLLGGVILWAVYVVVYLVVGLPLLGGELGSPVQLGTSLLGCLLITAVWVSLYTCLVNLIQAKSTVTAAAILLAFAMLLGSMFLYSRLPIPTGGSWPGRSTPTTSKAPSGRCTRPCLTSCPTARGCRSSPSRWRCPGNWGSTPGWLWDWWPSPPAWERQASSERI